MLKYSAKRLLQSFITILIVVTVVFLMMRMLPTDYYFTEDQLMKFTPEQKEAALEAAGLLDPIGEQLVRFYGQLLHLDFGTSRRIQNGIAVTKVIGSKMGVSMRLGMTSKDEAVMLVLLKKQNYYYHTEMDLDRQENRFINQRAILDEFPKKKLEFQENLWIYNDHLHNLNLSGCWEYKQQEPVYSGRIIEQGSGAFSCQVPEQIGIKRFMEFRLTDFGKHFVEACISSKCEEYI